MAIRQLTVKERILLHLFDFNRYADEYEVPLGVSQSGIASAVGIRVQHATQYLRPLLEADMVREGVRHIQKQSRRRKTYFLSPGGRQEASALRTALFEEPIQFHQRSGKAEELTLAQVYQEERRGSPLLELVREVGETGFLTGKPEEGPSEVVDFSGEAPPVNRFYGREEDLTAVWEALKEAPVVVVTGIAGIGKSTLAAKVSETRRGEESLFWREIRPWDSASDVGLRLAGFLQAMGRSALRDHLMSSGTIDLNRVEEDLAGDAAGISALLVFDDVHDASQEVQDFFSAMHRALKRQDGGTRVLFLSRSRPSFYSTADVELEASVREIPLRGLDDEVSHRFLADQGMASDAASSLVRVSGGSPLFLKLLAKGAERGGAEQARGSLEGHIAREIEPSLGEGEREILQLASFYAVPVPSEALLLGVNAEARDLISLEEKSLLDRLPDGRIVAHDFLRDYFGKSLPFNQRTELASQATSWLVGESNRLIEQGEPEGAITLAENAVAVEPEETGRVAHNKLLGHLRTGVGDWTGALENYRAAIAGSSDPLEKGALHRFTAAIFRRLSRWEETRREIERGLALLPPGPSIEAANLLHSRVIFEVWTGEMEAAFRTLEEVRRWLPDLPDDPPTRFWWTDLMAIPFLTDPVRRDYSEALRMTEKAIEIYEEGEVGFHTRLFIQSYSLAAWSSFLLGQVDKSLTYVDRGWEDVEASGAVVERGNLLSAKGYALSEGLGQLQEAEEAYNEAQHWLKATRQDNRSLWMPHLYAGLYRRQGRPEDARESLAFFLARGEDALDAEDLIETHALMVRLCVECGDIADGQRHMSRAEDLLKATPSDAARFAVAWARGVLLGQRGDGGKARTSFEEAMTLDPPPFRGVIFQKEMATEFLQGEFLLDYGRLLASIGEEHQARKVLKKAQDEAQERGRKLLEEALLKEVQSLEGSPSAPR